MFSYQLSLILLRKLTKEIEVMHKSVVIEYYETQAKVAAALGITRSGVSFWSDLIPEKQAMRLERITEGELKYDPSLYENKNSPQTKH